jgi:hypothetical protein
MTQNEELDVLGEYGRQDKQRKTLYRLLALRRWSAVVDHTCAQLEVDDLRKGAGDVPVFAALRS